MHVDYFHAWDLDKDGKLTLEEVWSLVQYWLHLDLVYFHFFPRSKIVINKGKQKLTQNDKSSGVIKKKSKMKLAQSFRMILILNLWNSKRKYPVE